MATYFLSYARKDQGFALKFADDLIAAGAQVWVDQYDIHPSQHWDRAVETAVRGCSGVVVILSPRSVASSNVADEISVALDDSKPVIPVLIEPCKLPLRMTRMQFIDATKDYPGALAKTQAAMQAARTPEPDAAPDLGAPQQGAVLAPEVLRQAELRLTSVMGPIAGLLVRQASRSPSEVELYQALARSIMDPRERQSFLAWVSEPITGGRVATPRGVDKPAAEAAVADIPADELEALSRALTHYMGPIASRLVARESVSAESRDALRQRLAERIADAKDRAAFLHDTRA